MHNWISPVKIGRRIFCRRGAGRLTIAGSVAEERRRKG